MSIYGLGQVGPSTNCIVTVGESVKLGTYKYKEPDPGCSEISPQWLSIPFKAMGCSPPMLSWAWSRSLVYDLICSRSGSRMQWNTEREAHEGLEFALQRMRVSSPTYPIYITCWLTWIGLVVLSLQSLQRSGSSHSTSPQSYGCRTSGMDKGWRSWQVGAQYVAMFDWDWTA